MRALRIAAVVAWLCFVAWFVRFEAYPEYFTRSLAGYESLLSRDVLVTESWMRILFKESPIGYSHTSMDSDESDPVNQYTIENEVHLALKLMGERQRIHVTTSASLDATYTLQEFEFSLVARKSSMRINATRIGQQRFRVKMNTGRQIRETYVSIPDNTVLYSPMTEMAMKRLKPGERLSVRTLDPASMSPIDVVITALRKESLSIGTNSYDATVLCTEYLGMKVSSWLDSDGTVLRQETPFGWTLERCTFKEALATLDDSGDSTTDLLSGMAVPCRGSIDDPRNSESLRLRLTGVDFSRDELERSPRQSVATLAPGLAELTVLAAATGPTTALSPDEAEIFLAPSPYIQCEDPEMRAEAARITAAAGGQHEKANAICRWVYRNVAKVMTVSLPSALDVLHTMEGDCNEHTYLFVGLCRAAGLPSKVMVGLAYHEGAFYYHAWPAVHVGRWVEMDPTWGQEAVDATHIAFVEGELAGQLQIVKIMGKLQIEVIDDRD